MSDPKYHLRVARGSRLVASNVLWFDWCGYVYAECEGAYDLSVFLRNVTIAGALTQAYAHGRCDGIRDGAFLHQTIGETP